MSDTVRVDPPEFPPFIDRGYKTILADPPWPYEDDLPEEDVRGARAHYGTLDVGHVKGLGECVQEVTASNAHCYLWTTAAFMEEGHEVLDAWGFDHKTTVVWVKTTESDRMLPHERSSSVRVSPQMGMGHYYRNCNEFLLIGVKGSLNLQRQDLHSVLFAKPSEHSTKPDKSYRLIEQASPAPRLEMFSRRERKGWDVWGDEVSDLPEFPVLQDTDGTIPNPEEW